MTNQLNILLIEDQQILRKGLQSYLSRKNDFEHVLEAACAKEALAILQREAVDVILMDMHLPDRQGCELIEEINRQYPSAKILVLSNETRREYVLKALQNGALGYVVKTANIEELSIAIKALASGNSYFSAEISSEIMANLRGKPTLQKPNTLSPRELQILKFISQELTNREIAEKLFISIRTVDTHKRNLKKKLRVRNSAGLMKYYLMNVQSY